MTLVEVRYSKYPIIDDLEIPEDILHSWQNIIDMLAEAVNVPAALIMRVHANDIEVFLASNSEGNVYPKGEKAMLNTGLYCETVMDTQKELLVPDATKNPKWGQNPDIEEGMISYCGLPLIWPNGEIFGTICVLDVNENPYSDTYRKLMETFQNSIQLSLNSIYKDKELTREKDKAKLYLETTQTIMVVLDETGTITMINRAGCDLLGYAQEELLGQSWFNTCLPKPEGMENIYPVFLKIMAGHLEGLEYVENNVLCKDGSKRLVAWHNAYFDAQGKISSVLSSGQDITEMIEAQEALVCASKKSRSSNKAKSQFITSMNHELRTPLNAILGFSQLLTLDNELKPKQLENVREVEVAGRHMLALINDILDLAKIESGDIDLQMESVEVCSVCKECMSLTHSLAKEHDIKVILTGCEKATVQTDKIRLKQVIINLLSNAIKYNCEHGKVILDIRTVDSERVYIRVEDTGQGIPSERMNDLFQPFNRLDYKNSEIEGTGVGLVITKKIIESMGGTLNVESTLNIGSVFGFGLPIRNLSECQQYKVS